MYQNIYHHAMTFRSHLYRSDINHKDVRHIITSVVADLNTYYLNSSRREVKCKKYLNVKFGCDSIIIELETEFPLPNPNRKGQCMRQLSRFLITAGFGKYLTLYDPKKLLSER
jgi:hypothetical protein